MATIIEDIKYTEDELSEKLFLSSVETWYNKKGVRCQIENIGNIFQTTYNKKNEFQIPIRIRIKEKLEKCRVKQLNSEGKSVKILNEITGNFEEKIILKENPEKFTIFTRLKTYNGKYKNNNKLFNNNEENEFLIHRLSKPFSLINPIYIHAGKLPENNQKSFITNYEELKETLIDYNFTAKTLKRVNEINKQEYIVLVAEKPWI